MTVPSIHRLRVRHNDVLTCIANLSNDEVFTPPSLANRMLDTLAETWDADHNGDDIWADENVTFLDPCTKSGVFLREIARRLITGLENKIPDVQKRVDHILTKQVYGIAITSLTAMLARRSLYCSKHADGKHSVTSEFTSESGNIWFARTEHIWGATKCEFCEARRVDLERDTTVENYAHPFLHTHNIKDWIAKRFGENMQFDVIIGNPPYHMRGGGGGSNDSSIYHLFVEQAARLDPKYTSMVIPSRWLAGGRGLGGFRANMLESKEVSKLVDYPNYREVFPSVNLMGGVCYFLKSAKYKREKCAVTIIRDGKESTEQRELNEFDVFIRNPISVGILRKVLKLNEPSIIEILTADTPFGLASNFRGYRAKPSTGDIKLYLRDETRKIRFVPRSTITKNDDLIDKWKVLVPGARGGGETLPDVILGQPWVSPPPSAATQTFIAFYVNSKKQADSIESYYRTKFFRHLVSLRKITQQASRSVYSWVPKQTWDRQWSDVDLYEKYSLTKKEIDHIESSIKEMPRTQQQKEKK